MFGLAEATGAQDAWYRSAILREEAIVTARPFSGSCDDIWKAYDGISRQLTMAVACVAGFPRGLARAYIAYHQGLSFIMGLLKALGPPAAGLDLSRRDAHGVTPSWAFSSAP